MYKYKGLPCPNPEDAKQSAAAIAISNLPVSWYRVVSSLNLGKGRQLCCAFAPTMQGAKMSLLPYPMYPAGPYVYPMMPYQSCFHHLPPEVIPPHLPAPLVIIPPTVQGPPLYITLPGLPVLSLCLYR